MVITLCSLVSSALTKQSYSIHDVSYKAFFDTLDAQGRSLLRFLHVSPPLLTIVSCTD